MPTIRSPEPVPQRKYRNDWVEKPSGLINDVGQTFVMRVGQVPLERRWLDRINRKNRNQNRMAAEWFLICPHCAAARFFDRFCYLGHSFRRLGQSAFCRREALCAGLSIAWPLSGWCAFRHSRHSILVPIGPFSVANYCDHDRALSPAHIAFEVNDLLPSTEQELAFGDGYRQRWAEQRCLEMGVAVSIMPGLLVPVITAGRNELVQNCRQVALQARLEFNRTQRGRTPHVEDMHQPSFDSGRVSDRGYLFGEVMHVPVAFGAERDLLLIGHERLPRMDGQRKANLVRKIETTLSFGLDIGAALAFTIWHEPGCGTLLTLLCGARRAVRQPLSGKCD